MEKQLDPLILALFDRLPEDGSIWELRNRMRWLRATASAFELAYDSGDDHRQIQVDVAVEMQK